MKRLLALAVLLAGLCAFGADVQRDFIYQGGSVTGNGAGLTNLSATNISNGSLTLYGDVNANNKNITNLAGLNVATVLITTTNTGAGEHPGLDLNLQNTITSGLELGAIKFSGNDPTGYYGHAAAIVSLATENWTTNKHGSDLRFYRTLTTSNDFNLVGWFLDSGELSLPYGLIAGTNAILGNYRSQIVNPSLGSGRGNLLLQNYENGGTGLDVYSPFYGAYIQTSGNSTHYALQVTANGGSTVVLYAANNGNVGIGNGSPAAKLDVNGGAFVQSLTLTNGTYPSDSAITNGQAMGSLWFGGTSSNTHTAFIDYYKVVRSVVAAHGVVLTDVTVTNSATATTNTVIYTVPMAANYLTVGKVLEPQLDGVIWQNSNVGTFPTLQAWINQTNLLLTIPLLNSTSITAGPWQANFRFTVRAIGNSAQLMGKCLEVQSSTSGGVSTSGLDSIVTPVTFDSTVNNTITITVSNSVAGGGGNCSVRLQEGRTVCIDSVPKLPGEL